MDPIKMEKFEAMQWNKKKNMQLLPALLQLCLRVAMLGLFLSSPLWLPVLCSSARFFFMETLPGVCALLSRPKCLFIISNVIIIFLVGESKLSRPASPQPDIYEEYVARRQSIQKAAAAGGGEHVCEEQVAEATVLEEDAPRPVEETKEAEDEVAQVEECGKEEEEIDREREEEFEVEEFTQQEEEEQVEEDEMELPAEELNRRVEDFIAKVNMQRKLEARMLLLCY